MIFKLGILASGNGTDLDAIYKEIDEGKMPGIEVVIVLSNVEGAPVLGKADARGLRAEFVNPKGKSKEDYDLELVSLMKEAEVDLVCLIGYMKVLTPVFVREFPRHIINVHPALCLFKLDKPFCNYNAALFLDISAFMRNNAFKPFKALVQDS